MMTESLRKFIKFSPLLRYICTRSQPRIPCVAIVGSGPAGFYTAQQIIKKLDSNVNVDIYEKHPVPFGLVRYGVAPDHPEVKNVINTFTQVAQNTQFKFFGNIEVGKDVLIKDLRRCYSAVVLSCGCPEDKRFNIPGENLKNVLPASSIINWYNSYPGSQEIDINLEAKSCIILGQGNVAVDIARILLSPISLLQKTDISSNALKRLSESKIEKVYMVGRRGPLQAAFTPAEFRATLKIPGCRPILKKDDFVDIKDKINEIPRPRKRITELQIKTALEDRSEDETRWSDSNKELHYVYNRSPLQFLPDRRHSVSVGGIEFCVNRVEGFTGLNDKAVPTEGRETIDAHLVIKSIGFNGKKIEHDMPFDESKKIVPNKLGRVTNYPGLYCSGWLKTGPTGVIVSTMNNAFETAKSVVEDIQAGSLRDDRDVTKLRNDLLETLRNKYVTFSDWMKLDKIEIEKGQILGKSREKIIDPNEMLRLMRE